MRIKDGFVLRKLGTEYVAVAMGEARKDFNGLVRMNETGRFLWECLKTDKTAEELLACLCSEYDIERAEADVDVREFLDKLEGAEILV